MAVMLAELPVDGLSGVCIAVGSGVGMDGAVGAEGET
jgi:hypothetical protein